MGATYEEARIAADNIRNWLRDPQVVLITVRRCEDGDHAVCVGVANPTHDIALLESHLRQKYPCAGGIRMSSSVRIDVVETGPPVLDTQLDKYMRPARGGARIQGFNLLNEFPAPSTQVSYGTLGLSTDIWKKGELLALTAAHVLATPDRKCFDYIAQPTAFYYDPPLATVSGYISVKIYRKDRVPINPVWNEYDFAWCNITPENGGNMTQPPHLYSAIPGIRQAKVGEEIAWLGSKTQEVQRATVTCNTAMACLPIRTAPGNVALFKNLIFSEGGKTQQGDSGAAIIATKDFNLVGLHSGKIRGDVFATPIPPAQRAYGPRVFNYLYY